MRNVTILQVIQPAVWGTEEREGRRRYKDFIVSEWKGDTNTLRPGELPRREIRGAGYHLSLKPLAFPQWRTPPCGISSAVHSITQKQVALNRSCVVEHMGP